MQIYSSNEDYPQIRPALATELHLLVYKNASAKSKGMPPKYKFYVLFLTFTSPRHKTVRIFIAYEHPVLHT